MPEKILEVASVYPKDFFQNPPSVKGGRCFVVMPFADELTPVFSAIQSALSIAGVEMVAHRADNDIGSGPIMEDILRHMAEAELVIVDLTNKNPNVFYELGIAHTTRCHQSIVLIAQSIADVPFDVTAFRCMVYSVEGDGLSKLQDELVQFVKSKILPTRFVFQVREGQTSPSDKVLGKNRSVYSFAICDVILVEDSAEFRLEVFQHSFNLPPKRVYNKRQRALRREERVPIPGIPYAVKFDGVEDGAGRFCVCHRHAARNHAGA